MTKIESVSDIDQLIKVLPKAAFLKEYASLIEEYEEIDDVPLSRETLTLAVKLIQLFLDPQTFKAMGEEYPEEFKELCPTTTEIRERVDVANASYIDLIASSGKTYFSFYIYHSPTPDPKHPDGHIVSVTTKLIDGKTSGLSQKEIKELIKTYLREFQDGFKEDDFDLYVEESTGDLLLRGYRAFEPHVPLGDAVELAIKLMMIMNLAPEIKKVFAKANPDSFWFGVED